MNDVILALVTATIRRYVERHGDSVKGRLFRVMVPVNLRGSDSPDDLGNRISLVPVTIPLDIRDPRKLLAAVHKRTEFLKRAHAAELVSLTGGLLGMIPAAAQAMSGHVISRLPFTPFNMVCTNVPGPQHPLYLLGRKMVHCYPYVPVGGEMSLNCAILTYNGTAYFGFSGDVHAVPDMHRLETMLRASFAELRRAVGIVSPPEKEVKKARKNKKAQTGSAVAKTKVESVTTPVRGDGGSTGFSPTVRCARISNHTSIPGGRKTGFVARNCLSIRVQESRRRGRYRCISVRNIDLGHFDSHRSRSVLPH